MKSFCLRRCSSVWLLSFTFILAHINSQGQPRFIKAKPAPASAVQRRLSFKRCTLALLFPPSSISPLGPVVVRRAIYAYIDLLVCVLAPCEGGGFLCGVLGWLQWAHIWPAETDQIGEQKRVECSDKWRVCINERRKNGGSLLPFAWCFFCPVSLFEWI